MKKLIYTLVFPLTIISMFCFTKIWFTLPFDAPDTLFKGFPFPYECNGWHTSMSIQFFLFEFIFDFIIYFGFWWILILLINKFIIKIKIHKLTSIALIAVSFFIVVLFIWFYSLSDNLIYLKRNFKYKLLDTRYKFIWEKNPRFELKDYDYKK